jgi:hypothetical protein
LFGTRTLAGCVAGFQGTGSDGSIFVAITFSQPGYPAQPTAWTSAQAMPSQLRRVGVQTIATQVVVGVDRFE